VKRKREEMDEVTLILRDLKNDEWTIRQDAVFRIGRLENPETLNNLIERVGREKWYIREMVAAGIRSIDNPAMAGSMKKGLQGGDNCIRNACARALGLMRCTDAEELLLTVAADPDCRVRMTAQSSLELIKGNRR
jgi:HEAT repeat protein